MNGALLGPLLGCGLLKSVIPFHKGLHIPVNYIVVVHGHVELAGTAHQPPEVVELLLYIMALVLAQARPQPVSFCLDFEVQILQDLGDETSPS